jgi:hypothetical protein
MKKKIFYIKMTKSEKDSEKNEYIDIEKIKIDDLMINNNLFDQKFLDSVQAENTEYHSNLLFPTPVYPIDSNILPLQPNGYPFKGEPAAPNGYPFQGPNGYPFQGPNGLPGGSFPAPNGLPFPTSFPAPNGLVNQGIKNADTLPFQGIQGAEQNGLPWKGLPMPFQGIPNGYNNQLNNAFNYQGYSKESMPEFMHDLYNDYPDFLK